MKKRIILLVFAIFAVFGLASCKKEVKHEIKLEEVDTQVKWEQIIFEFKINGETEEIKIADNSLEVTIYENDERIATRNPSKNANTNFEVRFTTLKVNTEYELVVTASINQKKEELFRKKVKTLLEGGHESDPIVIASVEDFRNINNVDAYYKLANDIDFGGEVIPEPFKNGLKGQFDGAGFKLRNFALPYENYNGIFGYMSSGTGVIKNLVIEDVTYNNYVNIENRFSVSLYVGLLTKELNANAKVSNITFNNINVNLFTETYGVRYFGLVAASNKGTIENITLNNVNFNIDFNNVYESQIGGVVGKNYSTGTINKVHYASGDFNIVSSEHLSNPQNVYLTYFGTIVGEGSGKISEVVSNANINFNLKGLDQTKKLVNVEGERFTVHALSLKEGVSTLANNIVDKTDEVTIKFNYASNEAIDLLLIDGVDKTAEVVDKQIVLAPTAEHVNVVVSYKSLNTTQTFTLTGDNYKVLEATLEGAVVYDGTGELPESFTYGTVFKVKPEAKFGRVVNVKLNGVVQTLDQDGNLTFTLVKNTRLVVKYTQVKTIYIGGIGGAIGKVDNALYQGNINFNLPRDYNYFEEYHIGALAGTVYGSASNIAVNNTTLDINSNSVYRSVNQSRLVGTLRGIATVNGVVVNSTIKVNGLDFNDLLTSVTIMPEDAFTSEFVKGLALL